MNFWLILVSALAPVLVLTMYILSKDKKRPEPFKQIAKGFGYGCLSVVLTLIVVSGIPSLFGVTTSIELDTTSNAIKHAFFLAAFPEEAAKLLLLWLLLRKNPFFDEHMDGIVYAVCVGMGFAAMENVMYLFEYLDSWQAVAISRAFLAIPGHFCFAVLMGYFFAIAYFNPNKRWFYALAYLVPVLVHGVYDACLMALQVPEFEFWGFAILLFLANFIFAIVYSKKSIRKHLASDDVALPVIPSKPIPSPVASISLPIFPSQHDLITHINPDWTLILPQKRATTPVSVKEALAQLIEYDDTFWIGDIILYNIPLRHAYRDMGADAFTNDLLALADNNEALARNLQRFNDNLSQHGGLADYDIQIYPKDATLTFFGLTIQGIEGIKQRIRYSVQAKSEGNPIVKTPQQTDLYVGCIWEPYPTFDSFDFADNRAFYNYLIREQDITIEDINAVIALPQGMNSNRITEHISAQCLPLVYYDEDKNTILVATARQ